MRTHFKTLVVLPLSFLILFFIGGLSGCDKQNVDPRNPTEPEIKMEDETFEGDITFTSQQELDDFEGRGLQRVVGDLNISQSTATMNITDLSALRSLEVIEGDLNIRGTQGLLNVDGLSNLTEIQGELQVIDNSDLEHLDGLSSLVVLGGRLTVIGNSQLINLDGLKQVQVFKSDIFFSDNSALEQLHTFSHLDSIHGDLSLLDNHALRDVDFTSLIYIDRNLKIYGSDLSDLSGFSGLKHVKLQVELHANRSLTDLGTMRLGTHRVGLKIYDNPLLTNLEGFRDTTPSGMRIELNPSLTELEVFSGVTELYSLLIQGNEQLKRIDFSSLERISANFLVTDNPQLQRLEGFQRLRFIGQSLWISNNELLSAIDFPALEEVDVIDLSNNTSLLSLEDFRQLRSLGHMHIDHMPITNLKGFENINNIGNLSFNNNPNLINFEGLDGLTRIAKQLSITNNSSLTQLAGIDALRQVDESMAIRNNVLLSDFCAVKPLFEEGVVHSYWVEGNAYNPSAEDILNDGCQE